eukprot:CAMPEP_0119266330 /NCGR_PEP_ID=MMETSP1329-20130426/4856_1 /TAXON_ID=114041 /ORGANISM="Genus nov. species nov., Strain RCC1024" /LENGTH=84 /DNA_ID=CAMNT_0007266201 /DNA_START=168 /DNA_END=422 /DNA_ORIENTATION=+
MKLANSDGVPAYKSEGAAPVTKSSGDGSAARNIIRKGGGGGQARKEGTAGHALPDASMDGELACDPGDPNYESPDDPERVSNFD